MTVNYSICHSGQVKRDTESSSCFFVLSGVLLTGNCYALSEVWMPGQARHDILKQARHDIFFLSGMTV